MHIVDIHAVCASVHAAVQLLSFLLGLCSQTEKNTFFNEMSGEVGMEKGRQQENRKPSCTHPYFVLLRNLLVFSFSRIHLANKIANVATYIY